MFKALIKEEKPLTGEWRKGWGNREAKESNVTKANRKRISGKQRTIKMLNVRQNKEDKGWGNYWIQQLEFTEDLARLVLMDCCGQKSG